MKKKNRQSNLELLRIVCILLIISIHYYEYGFVIPENEPVSINYIFLRFLGFGGHMGVNLFVIISGYFLVEQKFRVERAVKIWIQVSVITMVNFILNGEFGKNAVFMSVFSIPNGMYWFATTYFLLYIFSDFINVTLKSLTRRQMFNLICIMVTIVSVLPTFFGWRMVSSNLLLFIMLYSIGAYIRLYSPRILESKYCLMIGVLFHWACFAASAAMVCMQGRMPVLLRIADRMDATTDITIIIAAVLIFAGFNNLKIKESKIINFLARSTFGVYLIHCMSYFITTVFQEIFRISEYMYSPKLFIHAPITIICIYFICVAADVVYRYVIEKPVMLAAEKVCDVIKKHVKSGMA